VNVDEDPEGGARGLKFYELRHTFVALWVVAGVNSKEVSVQAGHSSVGFTLDRFGHLYERMPATMSRTAWTPSWGLRHSPNVPQSVKAIPGKLQNGLTWAFTSGPKWMLFKRM